MLGLETHPSSVWKSETLKARTHLKIKTTQGRVMITNHISQWPLSLRAGVAVGECPTLAARVPRKLQWLESMSRAPRDLELKSLSLRISKTSLRRGRPVQELSHSTHMVLLKAIWSIGNVAISSHTLKLNRTRNLRSWTVTFVMARGAQPLGSGMGPAARMISGDTQDNHLGQRAEASSQRLWLSSNNQYRDCRSRLSQLRCLTTARKGSLRLLQRPSERIVANLKTGMLLNARETWPLGREKLKKCQTP